MPVGAVPQQQPSGPHAPAIRVAAGRRRICAGSRQHWQRLHFHYSVVHSSYKLFITMASHFQARTQLPTESLEISSNIARLLTLAGVNIFIAPSNLIRVDQAFQSCCPYGPL